MELYLDGNDWNLTHLLPFETAWRQCWKEDWDPMLTRPSVGKWIKGTVPGDVFADALEAGLIPDPYVDVQSRCCEWVSERDWAYKKKFSLTDAWAGKEVRLQFQGVDHSCVVYLNGEELVTHEGMCAPFEIDITEKVRLDAPNDLTVLVHHIPPVESVQGQIGWTSQARFWKARFAYDWDWCTRLVPVGIWQSVKLVGTDSLWLDDLWARPVFEGESVRIDAHVALNGKKTSSEEMQLAVEVKSPDGAIIHQESVKVSGEDIGGSKIISANIDNPQLWYPNGYGPQPLYKVSAVLKDEEGSTTDSKSVNSGLRQTRFVPNDNAADDALDYTLEVNGQKVFVKGWNWVPIDHLYGRCQAERYRHIITMAKNANCNLLRVWGGGYLEREVFYELCDRFGIMVWQEFMQSSSGVDNEPPSDPEYLLYIEKQARLMVSQRRNHPSLVIWCGGNELMQTGGVCLSDEHPSIAVLKAIAQELHPESLWLPTSGSGPLCSPDVKQAGTGKMHDVHGPWQYQGMEGQYSLFNKIDPLFHAEFGAEGSANLRTLMRFVSSDKLFPPDNTNDVWVHHGAWWIHPEKINEMFGGFNDIETFVKGSQWMHAEGLRYALEANRRRKWHCSGTAPWQFNEAFPNTACTNSLDYMGYPKPVYWWVKRSYEPIHVSLKYDKLTWNPGDEFTGEIWLNNSLGALKGLQIQAKAFTLDGQEIPFSEIYLHESISSSETSSQKVGSLSLPVPQDEVWVVFIQLSDAAGEILSRNEYYFTSDKDAFMKMLSGSETQLDIQRNGSKLTLVNSGPSVALMIQIEPKDYDETLPPISVAGKSMSLEQNPKPDTLFPVPEDSYFSMVPGESREIAVNGEGEICVTGWNLRK